MNHVLDTLLGKLGLKYQNGIKKMGKDYYTHVSNISALPIEHQAFIESISPELLKNADFVKSSDSQLTLIQVEDITEHEPTLVKALSINKVTGETSVRNFKKNPPIYHHVWMMFPSDTNLIDVTKSKLRSLWWKSQMGVNRALSSKIGFRNFWDEWTQTLTPFEVTKNNQQYSSENTSINKVKLPAGVALGKKITKKGDVVVDYGCGKFSNSNEALTKHGALYIGFDPYNISDNENLLAQIVLKHIGADVVICSNVMNVICEDEILENMAELIVKGLKDDTSKAIITIYEGDKSGVGKIVNTKQYQRNLKTEAYKKIFEGKGARAERYQQPNAFIIQRGL